MIAGVLPFIKITAAPNDLLSVVLLLLLPLLLRLWILDQCIQINGLSSTLSLSFGLSLAGEVLY